jgi:GNAT-family acetyltransferase (TIGR03103 family)
MELSVMHDNAEALSLYAKLGFDKVPVFTVKTRSQINEKLFIGPEPAHQLNIYAQIIIEEARRRGIGVEVEDTQAGMFRLSLGSRTVACRESLSDLTSAVAMSRCDDKRLTHRLLGAAGLAVPAQENVIDDRQALEFLRRHDRVVVKPAMGEQGTGVSVDLRTPEDVLAALERVRVQSADVVMEEFVEGQDLRIIVIGGEVVAAAIRRPATITGDGTHTIAMLIEKLDRRRMAATRGESRVPFDAETQRCIREAGYDAHTILPEGHKLTVRKTANLHTGGTIHDVTDRLHPALADAASRAAHTLSIPVVGLDLMVRAPDQSSYRIIEANERPGLANHEPAPTAARFIDLLFPQSRTQASAS